MADFLIINNFL